MWSCVCVNLGRLWNGSKTIQAFSRHSRRWFAGCRQVTIMLLNTRKKYVERVAERREAGKKLPGITETLVHSIIPLTSPTGCSSSWQWQFIGVWTSAHHRTCRTTASRSPVLTLGGICVPPTVNYLQYLVTGSTLMAVGPFQLPGLQSRTLFRILSRTRPSVQTVSDVCLKRICLLDTSAFSALEVPDNNCAL